MVVYEEKGVNVKYYFLFCLYLISFFKGVVKIEFKENIYKVVLSI